MNIVFQRKVDRYVGTVLCRVLSLFPRRNTPAPLDDPARRFLIILLSEMGSLVLGHAMFSRLKERYPEASIYVLLFKKNREVLDLLDIVPQENILTVRDTGLKEFIGDSLQVLFHMRSYKFDVVIDCELFSRVSSIFSYFSGAAVRIGFFAHTQEGLYRGSFINRPVLYNPYRHISKQFLTLVEAIESNTWPSAKRNTAEDIPHVPSVSLGSDEVAKFMNRLRGDFTVIENRRLVLVYPSGGALPIRAWPVEHYCQLCKSLLKEGYAIAVIGLEEDRLLAKRILTHCMSEYCIDLTGYTRNIRELLMLFNTASLLITNDGGPGQFAALTSVPTIMFFGPETPELYGPLAKNAHLFHLPFSCSPCITAYNHRLSPCDGDNQCLQQIRPEAVLQIALGILKDGAETHSEG